MVGLWLFFLSFFFLFSFKPKHSPRSFRKVTSYSTSTSRKKLRQIMYVSHIMSVVYIYFFFLWTTFFFASEQSRAHLGVYLFIIWIILFSLSKYFTSAEFHFAVTTSSAPGLWDLTMCPCLTEEAISDILFCNQKQCITSNWNYFSAITFWRFSM